MNIGIFDSGLGGLIVMKSIAQELPRYDYVYFGDTKHMPYGEKSQDQIYRLTVEAVSFLFRHDCQMVVIACNTASAKALRRLQREWLPKQYPDRRVLGVIVPTLEAIGRGHRRVGLIATRSTVGSRSYVRELKKIAPGMQVRQKATPDLAGLIEAGRYAKAAQNAHAAVQSLQSCDALVLACTHYSLIKKQIRAAFTGDVYSQDELIAGKLKTYLKKHSEIERLLTKKNSREFFVSKVTAHATQVAKEWFGKSIRLQKMVKR